MNSFSGHEEARSYAVSLVGDYLKLHPELNLLENAYETYKSNFSALRKRSVKTTDTLFDPLGDFPKDSREHLCWYDALDRIVFQRKFIHKTFYYDTFIVYSDGLIETFEFEFAKGKVSPYSINRYYGDREIYASLFVHSSVISSMTRCFSEGRLELSWQASIEFKDGTPRGDGMPQISKSDYRQSSKTFTYDIPKMGEYVKACIQSLADQNRSEIFYAFSIDADQLCANSISGYQETLENHKKESPEYQKVSMQKKLKMNPAEWKHARFGVLHGDAGFDMDGYMDYYNDCGKPSVYLKSMKKLLKWLETNHAFDALNKSDDFKTFITAPTY